MDERGELAPGDLDRIEDALEGLEHGQLPADLNEDLRGRLDQYRAILELSRQALPLEDVRADALDGVLAEAHAAVGEPLVPAVTEGPSLWVRFRRAFLLPTLALAGSAAIVLWWIRPAEDAVVVAKADRAVEPRDGSSPAADEGRARADPAAIQPATVVDEPVPAEDESPVSEAAGRDELSRHKSPAREPSGTAAPAGGKVAEDKRMLEEEPADNSDAKPQMDVREIARTIDQGDKQRQAGRCGLAKLEYEKVLNSYDADYKARALAGLGLCEERSGRTESAKRYFKQARNLDRAVDGFIRKEQRRAYKGGGGATSSKRKAKAKPTSRAAPAADVDAQTQSRQ